MTQEKIKERIFILNEAIRENEEEICAMENEIEELESQLK